MALVATDVLTPSGEIDGELFFPKLTGPDVAARVTAYLTAGYAKADTVGLTAQADKDELARVYTYWRVWSDVVNVLTLSPASTSLGGDVSVSFLQTQIDSWITARDAWHAQLVALLPVDPTSTAETSSSNSGSIPTCITF